MSKTVVSIIRVLLESNLTWKKPWKVETTARREGVLLFTSSSGPAPFPWQLCAPAAPVFERLESSRARHW